MITRFMILLFVSLSAAAQPIYMPSPAGDNRFLHVAGSGLSTFQTEGLSIGFYVGGTQLTVDVFDGAPDWRFDANPPGLTAQSIELYEDTNQNSFFDPGEPLIASESVFDLAANDWSELFNGPIDPGYYVVLATSLIGQEANNRFKLRVDSNANHWWHVRAISLVASGSSLDAVKLAYPNYPDLEPVLYDGSWDLSFLVNNPNIRCHVRSFKIWNGDFDHATDTDDFNSPDLPRFASPEDQAQGANPGNPLDNNSVFPLFMIGDPISLRFISNTGETVIDDNPSGDREWEKWWLHRHNVAQADERVRNMQSNGSQLWVDGADINNAFTLYIITKCQ